MGGLLADEIFRFRADQDTVLNVEQARIIVSIDLESAGLFLGFKHLQETVDRNALDRAAGGGIEQVSGMEEEFG